MSAIVLLDGPPAANGKSRSMQGRRAGGLHVPSKSSHILRHGGGASSVDILTASTGPTAHRTRSRPPPANVTPSLARTGTLHASRSVAQQLPTNMSGLTTSEMRYLQRIADKTRPGGSSSEAAAGGGLHVSQNSPARRRAPRVAAAAAGTPASGRAKPADMNNRIDSVLRETDALEASMTGTDMDLSSLLMDSPNAGIENFNLANSAGLPEHATKGSSSASEGQQAMSAEQRLQLSEKIIRKLYHRNSQLESSLANMKSSAEQQALAAPSGSSISADNDVMLDRSKKALANYRQMKRGGAYQNNSGAAGPPAKSGMKQAKQKIDDLEQQLEKESSQRQQEVALYNSMLYQTEQQSCDWYVERKLLETELERLQKDIETRDQLESEIEACVQGLCDQLKKAQDENTALRTKLRMSSEVL